MGDRYGKTSNIPISSKGIPRCWLKGRYVLRQPTLFEIESQTDKEHWTFLAENLVDYNSEESDAPEYEMETIDSKNDNTLYYYQSTLPHEYFIHILVRVESLS